MSELDTFSLLPIPFASALQRRGYSELTPVQSAVLAPELQGKDLRISSRTGSGKTVALGLVVGPLLIDRPAALNAPTSLCARPRILLVAPTRELAAQIGRELEWLFADIKVGVCVVTGGTSVTGERRQLARGPLVVVGTPGRLCDHLSRGALDLSQAEAMVLDEADQMLELGFREALETLLSEIPESCRRHLVSATFPRAVLALASQFQKAAVTVTGGTSVTGERRQLARGPLVVVGTPGRLCDHLARGALDLSQAEAMVLDEADQMLELGFREALETLLSEIPESCRRHLVSATFPRAVLALASQFQKSAVTVTGGSPDEDGHEDITHLAYLVHPRERYAALVNVLLMAPDERTLVFVRTRIDAAEVAARLSADGLRAGALSGELAQAERTRTLDAFRSGTLAILVCTDVASRGLDVPEVARVIHAELPSDPQVLTHRSGRTGRAGRKGTSIMLVAANERGPAEMLLMRAGIHAELLSAPSQEVVRAEIERRLVETLTSTSTTTSEDAAAETDAGDAALATRLVAELGAEKAVERLLARLRRDGPSEPHPVTTLPLNETRANVRVARAPNKRAPTHRRARHG